MTEFVQAFQRETGANGQIRWIPRPLMRLGLAAARPINPAIARQIEAGLTMGTQPRAFDGSATRRDYPSILVTSFAEVVRRNFGEPADVLGTARDQ
jgi:hypothetical protein